MPSQQEQADADQVAVLLRDGESQYVEFKSTWTYSDTGERRPRELKSVAEDVAEAVVAFANAEGGDLLVGVEDDGRVRGTTWDDDRLAFLVQAPGRLVSGGAPAVRVRVLPVPDGKVLWFRVEAWPGEPLITSSGRCLMRQRAASVAMPPSTIKAIRHRRLGDLAYEADVVPQATLDDLDLSLLADLRPDVSPPAVLDLADPVARLRYWSLVEGTNGSTRIRRAALLLFAKEPLRWHANNRVRIRKEVGGPEGWGGRLNTREVEVGGPIVRAVKAARARLFELLGAERQLDGLFGVRTVLPEEAVEECLVNALVHRNYAIEGQAIEIVQRGDVLEVRSPGDLPAPLTLDVLRRPKGGRPHRSRNPLIMRVMRDLGWARDQGEGFRRIFGALEQADLGEPSLALEHDTFVVRLSTQSRHDADTLAWLSAYAPFGLPPSHRRYLLALREAGGTDSPQRIARRLGLPFEVVRRALDDLEQLAMVWHRPKAHRRHLVEPAAVPLESARRALAPLLGRERFSQAELAKRVSPAQRDLFVQHWTLTGVLTADGDGFRPGPALKAWLDQRALRGG